MIHNSVRRRVTFWYTLVIIILLISVIAILLTAMSVSNTNSLADAKDKLSYTVASAIDELKSSKNKMSNGPQAQGEKPGERPKDRDQPSIGDDNDIALSVANFTTYKNGVNFIIYNESGEVLKGQLPEDITDDIAFSPGKFTNYSSGDTEYIIYDEILTKKQAAAQPEKTTLQTLKIRGITPLNAGDAFLKRLIFYSLIIIPFFVIIASIVGYKLTKSAFKPIKQVTDMAHSISESGDLTKRIGLKGDKGDKDEIHIMANTFDEMLETIEEQFEARKRFTDDASHELRTPISVIIGQCELAENEKADQEQIADSVSVIKRQAKKMSKLVSQLLMFARVDKGKEQLNIEEIDLSETVEIVALELAEEVNGKNISITTSIEPGIMFSCDQALITRLIINLVTNAVKYGKENGHVTVSLGRKESSIVLEVADDGIGIAKENLEKIWERFFRVDPSREKKNDDGSSGLGLPISKWIVEAHNGSITVESTLGEGSTFTVAFPESR